MNDSESNRREQILDAALRVFARRGYDKATIKEIANEANVKSPALLYWYFPSKEDLLKAVLGKLMPILPQIDTPEFLMEMPPEEVFGMIGRFIFAALGNPIMAQLFKIFFSEALRVPGTIDHLAEIGPMRVVNFMTAYLQRQIDTGKMRPHDPRFSSRAFMGMLMVYVVSREMIPPLGKDIPESDAYLQEVLTLFLQGLRPN